jgi:hypothetical protein
MGWIVCPSWYQVSPPDFCEEIGGIILIKQAILDNGSLLFLNLKICKGKKSLVL